MGGLVRYFDEIKSRLIIKTIHVIIMIVIIIVLEIILQLYGYAWFGI